MTEVISGEAVILDVPCARFPTRTLARGIDTAIQLVLLVILFLVVAIASPSLNDASAAAVLLSITVVVIVGYPLVWETLTRGATPGKYALGLRVVSDDGGPVRLRQALVRSLAGVVEIWSIIGLPIALLCSMLSARGKRLGDMFAGTFVVQHRLPARIATPSAVSVTPQLAQWAAGLELSGLSNTSAETARRYLARYAELTPGARADLGARIATDLLAHVSPPPPPGTPADAYIGAVLAVRRFREQARLGVTAPAGYPQPQPAMQPQPTAAPPPPATAAPPPGEPPAANSGGFVPPR